MIKKSWEHLTIKQYKNIIAVAKNTEFTELEALCKMIEVIYEVPYDTLMSMSIDEIKKYDITFLKEPIPEFLMPVFTTIDGKKYKVVQFIKGLKFGQFVDLQLILSKVKDIDDTTEYIDKVVSCFLVDVETNEYIPNIDCSNMLFKDGYGIMLFFSKFKNKLETIIQHYLRKEEKKRMKDLLLMLK
jgi:hypothetical protein